MEYIAGISIFILGLIVGSFLNVVILRYNTGVSLRGRSSCLSCRIELSAADLFPLASFFVLKMRCRRCGSRISSQYPLVEFFTGLIFMLLFFYISKGDLPGFRETLAFGLEFAVYAVLASLLIVVFVYDLRHKIIPDGIVFSFIAISFLLLFFDFGEGMLPVFRSPSFPSLFSGPIVAAPLFLLWFFSGGRWMGLGDAKLALGIGWLLGIGGGASALIIAFWVGAVWSVGMMLLQRFSRLLGGFKSLTIKSELPFAPFLIIGLMAAFFLKTDLLGLSLIWGI